MTEENGAKAPEPTFSFNVSRKWGKRWTALMREATELQAASLDSDDAPGMDESIEDETARRQAHQAAMRAYTATLTQSISRLEAIAEEQEALIAQVLVDVPREWLSPDAPDDLDWSDPASQDWLLENRYTSLVQALTAARQANLGN